MKITVVGLGRIGLPTAAVLAESGHDVVGYDADKRLIANLASGRIEFAEHGVRELAQRALDSGRFHPSTMPFPADAFVVCTPTTTVERRADLSAVDAAFAAIAPLVQEGNVVILESTVPPGTTAAVAERAFTALGIDLDSIHVAHCPERALAGKIVDELLWNDRVIGGRRAIDAEMARAVYAPFARGDIHLTDLMTAETVKIVENAYRDVNLAFANELTALEAVGIDVWKTIALANCHPRVAILYPGPGVGGSGIPVDSQFLADANPFAGELIRTARRVNERMPHLVAKIVREFAPQGARKVVLLGASYKADVDDTRAAPAYAIETLLRGFGYEVAVYDPIASGYLGNLVRNLDEALTGTDVLVLVTDHSVVRDIPPAQAAARMRGRCIVDSRNAIDVDAWTSCGFDVHVVGRGRFPASALAGIS